VKAFGLEVRAVPKVNPKSAEEVWVTADGDRIPIGEMTEDHAKHALAMIMRRLRAGQIATLHLGMDRIRFIKRLSPSGCDAEAQVTAPNFDERFTNDFERDPFGQDSWEGVDQHG
jgi:hypothetical protein